MKEGRGEGNASGREVKDDKVKGDNKVKLYGRAETTEVRGKEKMEEMRSETRRSKSSAHLVFPLDHFFFLALPPLPSFFLGVLAGVLASFFGSFFAPMASGDGGNHEYSNLPRQFKTVENIGKWA